MASYIMPTLVTGFSPFDGRNVNSSWVAASSLRDVATLRIPVVWGKPLALLQAAIAEFEPNIIISMGEGKEEYFHIETVARNKRNLRRDNDGQLPSAPIITGAPDSLQATIDSTVLYGALKAKQIPIRISNDAGGFLCDAERTRERGVEPEEGWLFHVVPDSRVAEEFVTRRTLELHPPEGEAADERRPLPTGSGPRSL